MSAVLASCGSPLPIRLRGTLEFVVHFGAPVRWRLAIQEGQERPAVAGAGHLSTYPCEDGGHDVDGLGALVHDTTAAARGFRRRITQHQRNMETLVTVADLAQQVMVPELFTMITGEDNQGVVILSGFFQIPDDPPEVVIDLTNHAIVGRAHAAYFRLGHGAPEPLAILEELRLFH